MAKTIGKWWRFSEYQISNGWICPAPTAVMEEYDPWASYAEPGRVSWALDVPYASMLKLAQLLKRDPPRGELREGRSVEIEMSRQCENAVLDWCHQFGLIGIYPLRLMLSITLQNIVDLFPDPKLEPSTPADTAIDAVLLTTGPIGPICNVLQYCSVTSLGPGSGKTMLALARSRELVEAIRSDNQRVWEGGILAATHPIEDHDCHSPTYWTGYAEPVDSFVDHVWRFLAAADWLVGSKPDEGTSKGTQRVNASAEYLSVLANSALRYAGNTAASGLSQTEWAPSLFGSFARMLLDDYDGAQRVLLRCERCGAIVVSDNSRARYCSPKCRRSMMMRRYRDRKQRDVTSEVGHENGN